MTAATAPWDILSGMIQQALLAIAAIPGTPIASDKIGTPMKNFSPPASGAWGELIALGDDKFVATLGDQGQDGWEGIMQIDLHFPLDDGPKNLSLSVGSVLDYFKAGALFSKNGQQIKIRRSSPSGIRKDGATWVKSVSVYWSSWTQRS